MNNVARRFYHTRTKAYKYFILGVALVSLCCAQHQHEGGRQRLGVGVDDEDEFGTCKSRMLHDPDIHACDEKCGRIVIHQNDAIAAAQRRADREE